MRTQRVKPPKKRRPDCSCLRLTSRAHSHARTTHRTPRMPGQLAWKWSLFRRRCEAPSMGAMSATSPTAGGAPLLCGLACRLGRLLLLLLLLLSPPGINAGCIPGELTSRTRCVPRVGLEKVEGQQGCSVEPEM